jgi:hypothetical protein
MSASEVTSTGSPSQPSAARLARARRWAADRDASYATDGLRPPSAFAENRAEQVDPVDCGEVAQGVLSGKEAWSGDVVDPLIRLERTPQVVGIDIEQVCIRTEGGGARLAGRVRVADEQPWRP